MQDSRSQAANKAAMKNIKQLLPALAGLVLLGLAAPRASAWNGTGHMVVADIAYDHLTPKTKASVDALLQHQRDYASLDERDAGGGYGQRTVCVYEGGDLAG